MKKNKKSNKYINLFFLLSVILFQDITAMEYNSQDLQQNNNDDCNDNKLSILINLAPEIQFYIMSKLVEIQADYKKDDVNNHIVIKKILYNLFSTCKYFKQFDNKKDINYIITNISDLLKAKGNENYKFNTNKLKMILYKYYIKPDPLKIKKLILRGADMNIQDKYGNTALIKALNSGYTDVAKLLIEAGANINAKNNSDSTALMVAAEDGHQDIVELLVISKADMNIQNKYGNTALIRALHNDYIDIAKLLITAGADVDIQDEYGKTALIWATDHCYVNIVKLLITAGADVNIQDKYGNTALIEILASDYFASDYVDIVKLLIAAGTNINAKDNDGYTALMFATADGYQEIVELLIILKADINIQNKNGSTALSIARNRGHTKIINLLLGQSNDYTYILF